MWVCRRILRISGEDRVSNEVVLGRMNNGCLLTKILQGKVFGKRVPGRCKISWLKNLRIWFSKTN